VDLRCRVVLVRLRILVARYTQDRDCQLPQTVGAFGGLLTNMEQTTTVGFEHVIRLLIEPFP